MLNGVPNAGGIDHFTEGAARCGDQYYHSRRTQWTFHDVSKGTDFEPFLLRQ